MTHEQFISYERLRGFGYEFDYSDGGGRVFMVKYQYAGDSKTKFGEVIIEKDGSYTHMTQENKIPYGSEPAFPKEAYEPAYGHGNPTHGGSSGWNKLDDACIRLKVPRSGKPWLDDLIREAKRDEMAGLAMQGFCSIANALGEWQWGAPEAALKAHEVAKEMLAQKGEEK